MRIPSLLAALALMTAGAAHAQATAGAVQAQTTAGAAQAQATAGAVQAQSAATPPDSAAPPRGTGQGNDAVNPIGNASSSVNASGTVRMVPMSDLSKGANSFTEGQARTRIAGAGFGAVTPLTKDENGIWRGHGDREGRTFDVGFDFKGQVAFQ